MSKRGFTVIEIVLVLAIAGLVFAMVFIAFPALRRSRRDTQRRDDYAILQSQIIVKYSDNGGIVPNADVLNTIKVGENGRDPEGNEYNLLYWNPNGNFDEDTAKGDMDAVKAGGRAVYFVPQSSCNENGIPVRTSGTLKNEFSVYGSLESGVYCHSGRF